MVDPNLRYGRRMPFGIARRLGGMVVLAVAVMVLGCEASAASEEPLPTLESDGPTRVKSRADVEVDIRTDAPIRVGKNTLRVTFPERAADLTSVSALMAAHGHGSPSPAIERDGETFVVRDLVLFMSGRWELRLVIRVDSAESDEAIVAIDVP